MIRSAFRTYVAQHPNIFREPFGRLRQIKPIVRFKDRALILRYRDVVEVLERDTDFTVAEINDMRMGRTSGRFILGMDRSDEYEREAGILQRAARHSDLDVIRSIVRATTSELVQQVYVTGQIDLVDGLTRVAPTRLVDAYFGVPGHDLRTTMHWMRFLFWDIFLNSDDAPEVRHAADSSAAALHRHLLDIIAERKLKLAAGEALGDDILSRLIQMQANPADALDDESVCRNIGGVIIGAVDTTSMAAARAVDQLLDRPAEWQRLRRAALDDDMDTVTHGTFEALRFNPINPLMARHARTDAVVGTGSGSSTAIAAGTHVDLGIISAMFDPEGFPSPQEFRLDRPIDSYLHFGWGLHTCYGKYVNLIQIPELVRAVLLLKNVQRAPGAAGRIEYQGPFPNHFHLTFDT